MRLLAACSLSLVMMSVSMGQEPIRTVPAPAGDAIAPYDSAPPAQQAIKMPSLPKTGIAAPALPAIGADWEVMLHLEILEVSRAKPAVVAAKESSLPKAMSAAEVEEFKATIGQDATVRVLAEPKLVTLNGRQAKLMIGSELPYPDGFVQEPPKTKVRFVGTQLQALPMLIAGNNIRLAISCGVSDVDPDVSVVVQGTPLPAIRSREVSFTFEMPLTRTCVISGLIQDRQQKTVDPVTSEERTSTVEVETVVLVSGSAIEPPAAGPAPTMSRTLPAPAQR